MITVAKGFQTSINIAYDLHNEDKIKNFIPTLSSLDVIEDVLLSTIDNSTQRARLLVGAYGRGKSHIVLVLLTMLLNKDIRLFKSVLSLMDKQNPALAEFAKEYIGGDKKLLPIILSGSSNSLAQSFLYGLQQSLKINKLEDLMPETHFKTAVNTIQNWGENYPDTYQRFAKVLGEPIDDYISSLKEYNVQAFDKFETIYHDLTSGSKFNPYFGLDVVELYEAVVNRLQEYGYAGIYVVYDEFSKYLESSIVNTSIGDIKLLQDFAEKCNRSGARQMHLMLISHKDISNYVDEKLPKEKVDGWRGVSGRFKHVEIHNNFSQMYEIISAVIKKDKEAWPLFLNTNRAKFDALKLLLQRTALINPSDITTAVEGCYPLHPISTFILPRLSEKVAQNERTLFTFLSAEQKHSLFEFLHENDDEFRLLTPDVLYDYFEPLMRKEAWTSNTYSHYKLCETVLKKLRFGSLEAKIVKTITVIYIIEQYDKLAPVAGIIMDCFRESVADSSEVAKAIEALIDKDCIVYQKRSNGYLKIKDSSGVDISSEIKKMQEKFQGVINGINILNSLAYESCIYPTGYNDEHDVIRYFKFRFISSHDFFEVNHWAEMLASDGSDGSVFGIIPSNSNEIALIQKHLTESVTMHNRVLFIVPNTYQEIEKTLQEYYAISKLKELVVEEDILFDEYELRQEDLNEVITSFMQDYTRPELRGTEVYYMGERKEIFRKSHISALLSNICESLYPNFPIINNESINKNLLPTMAINSRTKLIAALLEKDLTPNLGLGGAGQEVSFMRSILIQTGILIDVDSEPKIELTPADAKISHTLAVIQEFLLGEGSSGEQCFKELYNRLTMPEYGIGLKLGIIPVLLAAVLHVFKDNLIIKNLGREVRITPDVLNGLNELPDNYSVCTENWTSDKFEYLAALEKLFDAYIIEQEKKYNSFDYLVSAMRRWFISLPKYSKDLSEVYQGELTYASTIPLESRQFIGRLKQPEINAREFLFETIPNIFRCASISLDIVEELSKIKEQHSNAVPDLIAVLGNELKKIFGKNANQSNNKASLASTILDWLDELKETTRNHLFSNNENTILECLYHITNDEVDFIKQLARKVTGLRIEDWNSSTIISFITDLRVFESNLNEFNIKSELALSPVVNLYTLSFIDENGVEIKRTFEKADYGARAGLLYNEMLSNLEEYGQALTDNEKRQVLLKLIERICKE